MLFQLSQIVAILQDHGRRYQATIDSDLNGPQIQQPLQITLPSSQRRVSPAPMRIPSLSPDIMDMDEDQQRPQIEEPDNEPLPAAPPRCSTRTRLPNSRYPPDQFLTGNEYEAALLYTQNTFQSSYEITYALNATDFSPQDFTNIRPISYKWLLSALQLDGVLTTANSGTEEDHLSFSEAWSHPLYNKAILSEVSSWQDHQVFEICDLPSDRKAIGYKWIFCIKYGANGVILKYKACLIARGDHQKYGLDYQETFAPVARMDSFRLLFSIAVNDDLHIHQMDVSTAFLGSLLKETIYMRMPRPWSDQFPNKVFKLHRSVYGLKQASRKWYQVLDDFLISIGFVRTQGDHAVCRHKIYGIFIAHWVDDILIFEKDLKILAALKKKLADRFKISDMGPLSFFLGMAFVRDWEKGTMFIHQEQYADKVLAVAGMAKCQGRNTPMDPGVILYKATPDDMIVNQKEYQKLIGSLMYLMLVTRPDLAHSVTYLAQFSSGLTAGHWKQLRNVLKYLKRTKHYGLLYTKNNNPAPTEIHGYSKKHKDAIISGFSDADFGSSEDRRSISGCVFFHKNNPISWSSKNKLSSPVQQWELNIYPHPYPPETVSGSDNSTGNSKDVQRKTIPQSFYTPILPLPTT